MEISEEIRNLRKKRAISQRVLARISGLSSASIVRFENGSRKPSPKSLQLLAEPLNTTVDRLMVVAGYLPEQVEGEISLSALQLAKEFDKMDDKGKQLIIDMAETIRRKTDYEEKIKAS